MDNNLFAPFLILISAIQGINILDTGFKIVGIITIILYNVWAMVFYQELRKLNHNYKDEQNYVFFAAGYLQLVIGFVLLLYALFLL
ncbi:MAG: DUF5657 family protein [Patescibacteria group bacterium]|jgi:hypothetical protein